MDLFIFAIGFLVSMTVVYGVFSQVPLEMTPPSYASERVSQERLKNENND